MTTESKDTPQAISQYDTGRGDEEQLFLRDTKLMQRLTNINEFQFRVDYQATAAVSDESVRRQLMSAGYGHINAVLKERNMHHWHELKAEEDATQAQVSFTYTHDRHHFQIVIDPDSLRIRREASSWSNFYNWYVAFMPMASRLESTLRKEIQSFSKTTLTPVQTRYIFGFILTNFRKGGDDTARRNLGLMAEIIPQLPDSTGANKPLDEQEFHRVDLNVSRREVLAGKIRLGVYNLRSPFNELGSAMWCGFELRGSSFEEVSGSVVRFDEDSLDDHSLALTEFLRDTAVERYLGGVVGANWRFDVVKRL